MASPKRKAPDEHELCLLSDFQILHNFAELVCKEHSLQAKALACEIIRRYTASRVEQPFRANSGTSILGMARWGDAKRVYEVFGLKRGPLDRISKAELIVSRSMEESCDKNGPSAVRAKRLYDLISIEQYLRSLEAKRRGHSVSVASSGSRVSSSGKKKETLKIIQK